MATTEIKELTDESVYPDETVLRSALGRSFRAYLALLDLYKQNGLVLEWRYYQDGKAWFGKVQAKKRTIVWMSARRGYMKVTIYIPEKYRDELFALRLGEDTKDRFRGAEFGGRSIPCTFDVRNQKILKDLDEVVRFKILKK